jgi:hypothetical protein
VLFLHLLRSKRSESESELLCDWPFTANQLVFATSPLRLTTSIFFRLNTCGHNPYITSSLRRGWVSYLQLLLVLARALSCPSPAEFTTTIYCLRFKTPPNLVGQVPLFISPRARVAQLHPEALSSLFVASYDLQGYDGGIRPRLHMHMSSTVSYMYVFISHPCIVSFTFVCLIMFTL